MRGDVRAPWYLDCPWCTLRMEVYARGQRGRYDGSGVEAADRMRDHVERAHSRSWREFLVALSIAPVSPKETP